MAVGHWMARDVLRQSIVSHRFMGIFRGAYRFNPRNDCFTFIKS